jgi:hypothetical protein
MTETCSPDAVTALPPVPACPETDGAAVRAIEEASTHIRERAEKIRDCVNQILATVKQRPAAG